MKLERLPQSQVAGPPQVPAVLVPAVLTAMQRKVTNRAGPMASGYNQRAIMTGNTTPDP